MRLISRDGKSYLYGKHKIVRNGGLRLPTWVDFSAWGRWKVRRAFFDAAAAEIERLEQEIDMLRSAR